MTEPIPRPIPIVAGSPGPYDDVAVVLRVIERGQPDLFHRHIVSGRHGWAEQLTHVLDRLIHETRLWVGVRHGIWICHVVPVDWTLVPSVPVPPISPVLRRREPHHYRTVYDNSMLSFSPDMQERYSQL